MSDPSDPIEAPLSDLPEQPDGVPWPTVEWPTATPGELGADTGLVESLVDEAVRPELDPTLGRTYGLAVVAGGRLVVERYGHRPVQDLRSLEPDPPLDQLGPDDLLLSWSMAKSITHLAVGAAVADGALALDEPVLDPRWSGPDDPRSQITWEDLLTMRPGLAWTEEYYDLGGETLPDVVTMLFGDGAVDVAAFAADKALVNPPGSPEAFTYSSGTTNIVTAALARRLGLDADAMAEFLRERIFAPIGMSSARPEFDPQGTFIGSSYVHATLRDWCRLGLLALRGGRWDTRALVPEGWIDHGRRPRSAHEDIFHGAHWWAWGEPTGAFGAHGFEGQRVICFPDRDVIVVRLGWIDGTHAPDLNRHLTRIADCFPARS